MKSSPHLLQQNPSATKKKKKASCQDFAGDPVVKNLHFDAGDLVLIPSRATYSSILAWEIPWTEEPGRLRSMMSQQS